MGHALPPHHIHYYSNPEPIPHSNESSDQLSNSTHAVNTTIEPSSSPLAITTTSHETHAVALAILR